MKGLFERGVQIPEDSPQEQQCVKNLKLNHCIISGEIASIASMASVIVHVWDLRSPKDPFWHT